MQHVLAIDVESSGVELMSLGAAIFEESTSKEISNFKISFKPENGKEFVFEERCRIEFWDKPENEQMKAKTLDDCQKHGMTHQEGLIAFKQWIMSQPDNIKSKCTAISDTAGFDFGMLDQYFRKFGIPDTLYLFGEYRPTRHTTSYYSGLAMDPTKIHGWGAKEVAIKRLGADPQKVLGECPYLHDHDPLNDARVIAWEFCTIQQLFKNVKVVSIVN